MIIRRISVIGLVVLLACWHAPPKVKTGAEVLVEQHLHELEGRRVGLVMNPTARIGHTHMLDILLEESVNVTALFAPEHGFRGEAADGEVIAEGVDRATGLPVFSLYGETTKPTAAMLDEVDLLLFDVQDVGARFYTYHVTLGRVLEAAAEHGVPVWVLDRPNPAGGDYVSGWMLEEQYKSFVGAYPVPMVHGMTLGELARMMIGEGWISSAGQSDLRVIPMEGWERWMKWPDTGLEWYPPSPNLPSFEHAYLYLGTVLFEGTTLSEGRGTDDPFLTIGSPQTDIPESFLERLEERYPAVKIERTSFIPRSIPGKAVNPKYENVECSGVKIKLLDYDSLDPVAFGVYLLGMMLSFTPDAGIRPYLYNLAGTEAVTGLETNWDREVEQFRELRSRYLIY